MAFDETYGLNKEEPFDLLVEYENGTYAVFKGISEYGLEMKNNFSIYYAVKDDHKIAINPAKIRAIGKFDDFGEGIV